MQPLSSCMLQSGWNNSGQVADVLYIYPFKGGDKSDDKFKTFDDNKDELGFAAKPISKILKVT